MQTRNLPLPAARRRAQRGTSLIEIMMVLVILLIGVFLAIRIFPTGFGTLRANENRTVATRLATRLLTLAKGDASENLPMGVLSAYNNNGTLVVDTTQDPDNLGPYKAGVKNAFFDDINHFHYIIGESVKVPLPTVASGSSTSGSVYTVKFGPLYLDKAFGDPTQTLSAMDADTFRSFLRIYGSPLTGSNIESNNTAGDYRGVGNNSVVGFLNGPQTYLIDYGDDNDAALIMLGPRFAASPARTTPHRTFKITLSYVASNGQVITTEAHLGSSDPNNMNWVDDVAVGGNPVWQPLYIKDPANPSGPFLTTPVKDVVPGSVMVYREFDRLPTDSGNTTVAWDTDDPYQYKLVSPNVGAGSGSYTFANIGVLNFNPAGANYSESTPYGQRAFTAHLDYAVLDWHIIRDDIQVPTITPSLSGFVPIHTSLSPIKQVGDTEADLTVYNDLYGINDPNNQYDLQAFNLSDASGKELQIGSYSKPKATDGILIDYDPRGGSYRTGTFYVNTAVVPRGSQIRLLYKADGDWAVALQKAYSQYHELVAGNPPVPQTHDKLTSYDQFAQEGMGQTARLWFSRGDISKSVSLSIRYTYNDTNNMAVTKTLGPLQVTIDQVGVGNDKDYSYVDLNPAIGKKYIPDNTTDQMNFNNATSWSVAGSGGIGIAYGTSVKARVIWHDSDTTTARWRVQDLDSNLTPAP